MLYSVVFSPLNYNLYAKEHYKLQAAWGGKCHFFFVLIAFVPILTDYIMQATVEIVESVVLSIHYRILLAMGTTHLHIEQ